MMLADMGADVIRVDRLTPGFLGGGGTVVDRGRRSIALDLKQPGAVDVVLRLLDGADALIEGFRPGVMERLGLGPDVCLARNRRLVYGRMTGWGQDGPLAQAAGHDLNYIALTGALHAMGEADRPPAPPLHLVGDMGGGAMMLAFGLLCALLEAGRSGQGQVVDAAICDGASLLATTYHGKLRDGDWVNRRQANMLDGGARYGCYACADGKYVSIGAIEPQFYRLLLERCGIDDPDFQRQWDRAQWPALRPGWRRSSPARPATNGARCSKAATPASPGARFRGSPGPSATPRARQLRRDRRHPPPGACAPAVAHAWAGAADSAARPAHRGTAGRPGLVAVRHPGPARTRRHRLNPPPGDAAMPTITQPYQTLLHTCEDGVATITLNRPAQRNALDMVMREELAHAVDAIRRDREVRVVILGGAGGAFCAGGDIGTMDADPSAEHARERMVRLLFTVEALITLDRPVIARSTAPPTALAGLALTADLVLATRARASACPSCAWARSRTAARSTPCPASSACSAPRNWRTRPGNSMPKKRATWASCSTSCRRNASTRMRARSRSPWPGCRPARCHHQARPERLAEQRPAYHAGAGSLGTGRGALVALPPRGRRTLPGQTGDALSVAKVLKMAAVLNAGGAPALRRPAVSLHHEAFIVLGRREV